MYYNQTIETFPLRKLRKLQNERLVALINRLYKRVPFYKKQWDEAGVKISKIKGVKDLHKLPFTVKTDLRDNYPFDLFAVPQNQIVRIHASSGTTGKPAVVGYNRKDLRIFDEVVARSLVAAGAKKGMKL